MTTPCPHCGMIHATTCIRISALFYHKNGSIKRVEFHPASALVAPSLPNAPEAPPVRGVDVPVHEHRPGLSEREGQVLACLRQGDSNKHIARALDITESTAKVHVKSLLRKLRVRNRTQAAVMNGDGHAGHSGDGA